MQYTYPKLFMQIVLFGSYSNFSILTKESPQKQAINMFSINMSILLIELRRGFKNLARWSFSSAYQEEEKLGGRQSTWSLRREGSVVLLPF